jgi:hypothetical protein
VASAAAALACSHRENGHAARPMNAVTHIIDGGAPPADDGEGRRNTLLGFAIHTAASIWWAAFYEPLKRKPLGGAAGIAALAYVVDYYVVSRRFQPGFEAYLSKRSLFAVYAALAAGFAASALMQARRSARRRPAGPT